MYKFVCGALLAVSSFGAMSTETPSSNRQSILESFISGSEVLGLETEQLAYAVRQFMKLATGGHSSKLTLLKDRPEYIANGGVYSDSSDIENELLMMVNEQKTALANFYGIPIDKLKAFEEHILEKLSKSNAFRENSGGATTLGTERIIIQCTEEYLRASQFQQSLSIDDMAINANIGQYQKFEERFSSGSSPSVRREVWKYNNFYGAWMDEVLEPLCDTCQHN